MDRLTRREMLSAVAGTGAVAVAGCLADGSEESEPPENAGELGTPAASFTVTIVSEPFPEFQPQMVHVEPGATVEWLVETGRHDVTGYHESDHPPHRMPEGAEPWNSEYLTGPGSTHERSFETEGIYDYVDTQQVCVSHEIAGNVGRVVVGWPDPETEPAMELPPEGEVPGRVRNAFEEFNERTRPVLEAGPEA